MKRSISVLLFALAACGGSEMAPASADAQAFIGTWSGTLTSTVTCPSQAPASAPTLVAVQLSTAGGADVTYTSSAGCGFRFSVSGATATMSNGPVSCTSAPGGVSTTLTVTSYTLTASDAHNMTASSAGTIAQGALTCQFTLAGPMTK